MPVLQYKCAACGNVFDELVKSHEEEVTCPKCHKKAERVWSGCMYSATGKPAKHCNGKCSECPGCH